MEGTGECYQVKEQCTESSRNHKGSYPVVCRWSQNDEGFLKSWISDRREIGLVRGSSLTDAICCTHSVTDWYN